jgi:lipoate-protein ligase B
MSLENKIAHWIDLGTMPYRDVYDLQLKMVDARRKEIIPDTILSVQHPLTVSFGSDKPNNMFSDNLLNEVRTRMGNVSHENVLSYLEKKGIDFVEVSRGGGATVLAPGQFVYYPVVDIGSIKNIEEYKNKIYKTLFSSLKNLGINDINISERQGLGTRLDRKDAWIQRNGVSLKMGSKGIKYSNGIAHQGFVLYVDNKGIDHFGLVRPCGYSPEEVSITSVESELGKKVYSGDVHYRVKESISEHFGYGIINNVMKDDFLKQLEGIDG